MSEPMIDLNLTNNINIVDQDDTFYIEHFIHCDEDSEQYVKECRGIIRLLSDKSIVCKTYPFTPEIEYNTSNIKETVETTINNGYKFYPSFEGSILRLWCYNNEWYLSTHRKLDANNSRWGSATTFRNRFLDALGRVAELEEQTLTIDDMFNQYTAKLNPEYIYTYMLRTSNENRIVCRYPTEDLFFAGAFDRTDNFKFVEPAVINAFVPTIKPITISNFEEFLSVIDNNVSEVNNILFTQGIIAVAPTGASIKFMNPNYVLWSRVRGNEPILMQAYINKLKYGNITDIQNFLNLYDDVEEFKQFEYIMNDIKRNLLSTYIKRYIHKKVVPVPPEQHILLVNMYKTYLSDPKNNVLNFDWVSNFVNNLSAPEIYNLYKQYMYRYKNFGNGNTVNEQVSQKTKNAYFKVSTTEEEMK